MFIKLFDNWVKMSSSRTLEVGDLRSRFQCLSLTPRGSLVFDENVFCTYMEKLYFLFNVRK